MPTKEERIEEDRKETHYMKHVHGQVRNRRDGWRTLGDFADT